MAYWVVGFLFSCAMLFRSGKSQECRDSAIGLRKKNGIPSYYFQASSFSEDSFKNRNKLNKENTKWCWSGKDRDSYLEVDLGSKYDLCGVSTQGDVKYKLSISSNRIKWIAYKENNTIKEFTGNNNASDIVKFTSTQKARFVRFYPIKYNIAPCMLIELFGTKIQKEICEKSSLSEHNQDFNITTCCLPINSSTPYLQIDIGSYSVVCAVKALDNTSSVNVQVKSYHLEFSMDGKHWLEYKENNLVKRYVTNEDHILYNRILCRYIRFTALRNVRVHLFGYLYDDLLTEDIGLKYDNRTQQKKFPDQSFFSTKTSQVSKREPKYGRLYQPVSSWCSNGNPTSYLEIVLVKKYYIFAVSVQGFYRSSAGVLLTNSSRLLYSLDYQKWFNNTGDEWIIINKTNGVSTHLLRIPIEARIVRFEIPYQPRYSCLQVELHGISAINAGWCPSQYPLGLSKGLIEDKNIEGSSYFFYPPSAARLRNTEAWDPKITDKNPHITIDLGELVLVNGVATQGFSESTFSGRMTSYGVRYSYNGKEWYNYTHQNNSDTIFDGNISPDYDAIFANWLDPPIVAKFIRVIAFSHSGRLHLRMELYGCRNAFQAPAIKIKSSKLTLNRTVNAVVKLTCIVHGQPDITITWTRDGQEIQNSSFEANNIAYPLHAGISGTAISNLTITYKHDLEIHERFNCTKNKTNSRELHCRSLYECSASYPGGNPTKRTVTVNVAPNIVLPGSPRLVQVMNLKSKSAMLNWKAAEDYKESRLTAYIVHLIKVYENTTKETKIMTGLTNSSLFIRLSNLSEYTKYSVKVAAVNSLNTSSFTEKVNFITLLKANISLSHYGVLQVNENNTNVSIVCTGISYPTPIVTWRKDNETLTIVRYKKEVANYTNEVFQFLEFFEKDNKHNETIKVTSTLFLRPAGINFDDHGNYTCEVFNRNESSIAVSKMIAVFFPPRITEKPQGGQHFEGANITLTCIAKGPPAPLVSWNIDKDKVFYEKTDYKNGTLVLKNLKSRGAYLFTATCCAKSAGGERCASARVEILVKPRITNVTKTKPALLYHDVTLNCTVLANPPPRISWTKDNKKIMEKNIQFQDGNKTLIIKNSTLENIGNYSCFAQNKLSNKTKSISLNLKALPKVHIIGDMTRKLRNKQTNVTVTCYGFAYPKPSVSWKRNDSDVERGDGSRPDRVYQQIIETGVNSENITGLHHDENLKYVKSILHLRPKGAVFDDYGQYTCEVTIGTDISNRSVEVIFYPIIVNGPMGIIRLVGQDAMFDCVVDGQPVPSTVWLFENKNISTKAFKYQNGSLKLYAVQNTNSYEGTYSCYAKNKAGKSKEENASLTVHVPARIVKISPTGTYQLKDDVPLTCNVSGDPFPNVTWRKINESIWLKEPKYVFSNDNQTLTIRDISLREQGTYRCKASNEHAVEKKNVTVYVEVSPNATVNASIVFLKNINEMAVIKCTGIGFPAPLVRWFRKGKQVETNSSLDVYQSKLSSKSVKFLEKIVSILYVNPDETFKQFGNYTCNATKTKDNEQDLEVVEIVLVPTVNIVPYPYKEPVLNGTYVQFNCTADGSPKPWVKWSRVNNSSNEVLENTTKLGNTLLVLGNVTNKNEGIYICSAKNRGKPVTANVTLTVHVKPRILISLGDADVKNGTAYQLNCSAYGDPDVTYTWNKDGDQTIPNSIVMNQNKSLKIYPVKIENEGIYTCVVKNIEGNDSTTANITVFARPEILKPPKSQTLNETQNVTFYCISRGIPTPVIIWRKNGNVIRNDSRYNLTTTESINVRRSTLIIHDLKYVDRGNYSCTMSNRKDFQKTTAVLTVQVPPQARPIKPVYRVKAGRSVNLTCEVYGYPRPNVLWKKNGENINQSQQYRIFLKKNDSELKWHSILEIKTLQRDDNGSFTCFLENAAGNDKTSLSLVVLERPDPLYFSSKNLTSRTIILEWKVTFDGNSNIKQFVLRYSSNATDDGMLQNQTLDTLETFFPNETMVMVGNLKPWRWYTFQIKATNDIGSSNASFSTNRTSEDSPSSPENVSVIALNATALRVKWLPPKEENGIITKYVIYYGEKGQSFEINASTSLPLVRDIVGLKPFTNYTIQIEAYTSVGAGEKSSSVVGQTNQSTPSKPQNVRTEVVSSTSMLLEWSSPERENGIILSYTIYMYVKYYGKNETIIQSTEPGNSRKKLITTLKAFTNYTFQVQASTSAGGGNLSEMVSNRTAEGAPSKIRYLSQTSSTKNSVTIIWDAPEHINGILTQYTIRYTENKDEDYKLAELMKNTTWTIEDLKPYTKYFVSVRANTSVEGGSWSNWSQAATQPGENPPKPEGFNPATMIDIVLSPLTSKNRDIRFYRIIVVFIKDEDNIQESTTFKELFSYDKIKEMDRVKRYQKAYVAFAFKKENFDEHQQFTLGKGEDFTNTFSRRKRDTNEYKNGPLIFDSLYAYHLRGYTNQSKYVHSDAFSVSTAPTTGKQEDKIGDAVMIVIVVAAVLVMGLVTIAIWFRVKKKKDAPGVIQGMTNLGHPIPLPELRSYLESTDFSDEFQAIPKVVARARTDASRPENVQKNRYRNIVPYDYTKVPLSMKEGTEKSDYINASFIKGLRKPEIYIATQGPLPTTTNDFWRMVWEQECSVIVMLTGLEEDGKVKCYQYWPATPEGKTYNNISVMQNGQAVLADYTVRYFTIKDVSTEESRKVEHLHYTAWPDHGVPRYPGPLVGFRNRYRSALVGPQPAIVHCSAGCGRTGTFIALDYILEKLDIERDMDPMIDILNYVRELRGQRCLMVQTQGQYEFIHQAVLEAVTFAHTEISSADVRVKAAMLRETMPGYKKTKCKGEFEKLQQGITVEPCEDGSSPENETKNRSQVMPYDYNRVYLGEMPDKTDYINASLISGYQFSENFIATQNPLPNTVEDFWRMIYEQKCGVIVCISTKEEQDEFGLYWPSEGFTSYGPVTVTFGKVKDFAESGFVLRNFSLTDTRDHTGKPLSVSHFHFTQWPRDGLPQASSFLRLLAEVERAQCFSGNMLITVHCSDGCGRTGTMCAIVTAIDRVKLENSVDVLMTVRNLRAQRQEMVQNEIHYQFCYDAVVAFLASFNDQLYDNFNSNERGNGDFPTTIVNQGNRMVTKC